METAHVAAPLPPVEIRIGILGNVDAGKSSFVGVITHDALLDDGRGSARRLVMKHKHEIDTGRTSDINQTYLCTPAKTIDFIDLAGHEKYFKTTIKGINGNLIDYAIIVINANAGIQPMTREHIGIAYTMRIPMIIVYTKLDITPRNIYETHLKFIKSFYSKQLDINTHLLTTHDEIAAYMPIYTTGTDNNDGETSDTSDTSETAIQYRLKNVPIIAVSNVTGANIGELREFICRLPQYHKYQDSRHTSDTNFIINTSYMVRGIGLVVSGIVKAGTVKIGEVLNIGPFGNVFYRVVVRSIHNNFRQPVELLAAGYGGCLNIKILNHKINLKRAHIKCGKRIVSREYAVNEFEAKVKILHNPSTITDRYTPVIQCSGITQPAHIVKMNKAQLRSHDEAIIQFRFMYRPEYIEQGAIFIFREGLTKGIGKVQNIIKCTNIVIE